VELSVWDFAGQHEYYNSHHFFISTRTVFLVCCRLDTGEEGLKGLKFWLTSLRTHLRPVPNMTYFSIIIVGTYLDRVPNDPASFTEREVQARRMVAQANVDSLVSYIEVSGRAQPFQNISELKHLIAQKALTHTYMGELVPLSFSKVERSLKELRSQYINQANPENPRYHQNPVIDYRLLHDFLDEPGEMPDQKLQKALELLSYWGECIYFAKPKKLESTLILDPTFMTKQILGQLFGANVRLNSLIENGILHHRHLLEFWEPLKNENFQAQAPILMALMVRMEVCFPLVADEKASAILSKNVKDEGDEMDAPEVVDDESYDEFMKRASVVPALLPEEVPENLRRLYWFDFDNDLVVEDVKRIRFNVIPKELVSRLLSRLHKYVAHRMVWRYGGLFLKSGQYALLVVDLEQNTVTVTLRGDRPEMERLKRFWKILLAHIQLVTSYYPGVSGNLE